jgi:ribonuclease HI
VANKSLWQALMAAMSRMFKIEWLRVKGHNGYLLNECAGMLATKGVNNEVPYGRV